MSKLRLPKSFNTPEYRERRQKKKSADELVHELYGELIAELAEIEDPALRDMWWDAIQDFSKHGELNRVEDLVTWKRPLVDMEEFLFSDSYLSLDRHLIYPAVLDALYELDSDKYVEAVLKGCIGSGKTTIANFMLVRAIYKLSCMRCPQETFGVNKNSSLVFTIQSVRFNTARKAVFDELGQYLRKSPYFQRYYQYDPHIMSEMRFKQNNVTILPVSSSDSGAISMNVVGGILDEVNFMQRIENSKASGADSDGSYDQAQQLYNTLARRRRSRFTKKGKLPGILFVVSSSRFPDDFTEIKALEAEMCGGNDPQIFVYSHSQWSAKPRDNFLDEEFRVQIGNETVSSKILEDGDEPHPDCQVIDVPMDFYAEFTKDLDGCIRDYAGITTLSTTPFIVQRDAIYECMQAGSELGYENPFNVEEVDLSLGMLHPNPDKLRLDIQGDRACHIDLGLSRDACGLTIGHVAGTRVVQRFNPETQRYTEEVLPVIGIDLMLRVVPPPNGEIEFSLIRQFLIMLRDEYDLPIKYVLYDGFQSVDSRQILRKKGFLTDYQSVEKLEPYRTLRDALYDRRLLMPTHHFVQKELAELEYVRKNDKEKVDHKPHGTKDVSDSLCGVVAFLMKRCDTWNDHMRISGKKFILRGDTNLGTDDEDGDIFAERPRVAGTAYFARPKITRKRTLRRRLIRK